MYILLPYPAFHNSLKTFRLLRKLLRIQNSKEDEVLLRRMGRQGSMRRSLAAPSLRTWLRAGVAV